MAWEAVSQPWTRPLPVELPGAREAIPPPHFRDHAARVLGLGVRAPAVSPWTQSPRLHIRRQGHLPCSRSENHHSGSS